jgi:hypothetical protein
MKTLFLLFLCVFIVSCEQSGETDLSELIESEEATETQEDELNNVVEVAQDNNIIIEDIETAIELKDLINSVEFDEIGEKNLEYKSGCEVYDADNKIYAIYEIQLNERQDNGRFIVDIKTTYYAGDYNCSSYAYAMYFTFEGFIDTHDELNTFYQKGTPTTYGYEDFREDVVPAQNAFYYCGIQGPITLDRGYCPELETEELVIESVDGDDIVVNGVNFTKIR